MDPDRLKVAETIFARVADLPSGQRIAAVAEACGADTELRDMVQKLLSREQRMGGFMASPAYVARDNEGSESTGASRYRIVGEIGAGGMGMVYEAVQESPHRTVALKVIRPGLTSVELVRRFQHEAHVLGQLQHPGIAHIYEAGVTDAGTVSGIAAGQPFFAMEFIRGAILTDHAREEQLDARQRLELMAMICDAVQHAHQKGIIHRDLKPANIVVAAAAPVTGGHGTRAGGVSSLPGSRSVAAAVQPKILDFGVARLTEADLQTVTIHTDIGQLVGTVPYMSPEQVAGDSRLLDTRSDVYALGVILYELLTGQLPHDVRGRPVAEAVRMIQDSDPMPLSAARSSDAGPIRFRSDLETIVAKALEKDKERRYASAAELAADLRRYLRDEPILARRASALYSFRKFARRNPAAVGAAALAIVLLLGGGSTSTVLWLRARAARSGEEAQRRIAEARERSAQHSAARASAINQFILKDMLRAADPSRSGHDIRVADVLRRAAETASQRFAGEPDLEADVRQSLGDTYMGLSLYRESQAQLEQALALVVKSKGGDDPQALSIIASIAFDLHYLGNTARARTLLSDALATARRTLAEKDPLRLRLTAALGEVLQASGQHAEAAPYLRDVLRLGIDRLPEDDAALAAMASLGASYMAQHRWDEAAAANRELLARTQAAYGTDHPSTIAAMNNLIQCFAGAGQYDEAVGVATRMAEAASRVYPREHAVRGITLSTFGMTLSRAGRYAEAEPQLLTSFEIVRRALGDGRYEVERIADLLQELYAKWGKADDACRWERVALQTRMRIAGRREGMSVVKAIQKHQEHLEQAGRADEAIQILHSLAVDADRVVSRSDPQRCRYLGHLGRVCFQVGDFAHAEPLLLSAWDALPLSPDIDEDRKLVIEGLVNLYKQSGRDTEARAWWDKLPTTQPAATRAGSRQ